MCPHQKKSQRPHKLALYQWAVQHPQSQVAFLMRCHEHYRHASPTKLKEDFAGTAAVASAWVDVHHNMRALAIDSHGPTLRWAAKQHAHQEDLHLVQSDVLEVTRPRVDIVAALNFSVLVYHTPEDLVRYFRAVKRSLLPQGLFIMDVYGGPGSMTVMQQSRKVTPTHDDNDNDNDNNNDVQANTSQRNKTHSKTRPPIKPFTYHWQQCAYDAVTELTECRIHFTLADGTKLRNQFRYHWRLWSLPQLKHHLLQAGFKQVAFWCDAYDPKQAISDGRYQPVTSISARQDWVVYVVALR